jgi:acyl dehydratase
MTVPDTSLLAIAEGTEVSVSDWVMITQDMNNAFGTLTRDLDPLHMDPAWAAENGPFGGTIAFGFLTLSLLTHLLRQKLQPDLQSVENGIFLNYGFDRVRLITPVRTGQRIRGRFVAGGIRDDKGGRKIRTFHATVEIEGEARPAVIAEWLSAWVPPAAGGGTRVD